MSLEAFLVVVITGLVGCYWAGYKFGVVVRMLKNLGNHA
jgi:hypothetical protein